MAMQPFTLQDALQLQLDRKQMSCKKAHAFLKAWRTSKSCPAAPQGAGGPAASQGSAMPQPREPLVGFSDDMEDLTNSPDFDWRTYVASRSPHDLNAVFVDDVDKEQSIERFEIRFIKPIDRNCNQHRCDFVAHRSDGMFVRFHPSQGKDAIPVIATWEDIDLPTPAEFEGRILGHEPSRPAASQGHAWAMPQARGVYHALSQQDNISKSEGMDFLLEKLRLIEAENWGRCFWEDLTDQTQFKWPYLVAGLRDGHEVLQSGVEQFCLVWVGREWQRPAFYLRLRESTFGRERVLFLNMKAVWNAEAVKDILWC